MDLLTNLMEALKLAPNHDFQRWLKMRIDMWSTKQIDWKQDGSDLMEEAEQYYQELKTTRAWDLKRKILHRDLKCANVFVTGDKKYKLGDLNVSKVLKKKKLIINKELCRL